jgi:PhnB protein
MSINYKAEGYNSVTPFFVIDDAAEFINFITSVFDAGEISKTVMPDGKIMHAEYIIGDSRIMLSSSNKEFPAVSLLNYVCVEDVDAVYRKALDTGGESLREPKDEFYGDRTCGIKDKSGNQWWIGTHIEDVSPEEMEKRMGEMMQQGEQQ